MPYQPIIAAPMRRGDVIVARRDVGDERPQRVERRFVAHSSCWSMFSLIMCIGTWPGPSIIVLHVVLPRDLREFAERLQFAELRFVVGVGARAGTQSVAERERHVVRLHDLADLFEVRVEEVLLVVREAPLRHDRAAARDDAGHALGRHRHVAQQHAGVDR